MRPTEVDEAIAAAAEFLAERRSRDALWRDFHTLAGASADWVTAFVCYAVRDCEELRCEVGLALRALSARQRPNGGWAYNHIVPTDCDSTSWALLALSTQGLRDLGAAERARRFVLAHQTVPEGGFSTYNEADGIDRFVEAPDRHATAGWLAPHACVTSVALQALLAHGEPPDCPSVTRAGEYLLRARARDGFWMSYWWPGAAYNTFFALRALLLAGALKAPEVRALRCSGVQAGPDRCGGAFHTALGVLTELLAPGGEARRASEGAVKRLLRTQRPDGGWPSRPILRIPPPMYASPAAHTAWKSDGRRGSGVIVADPRRVFTTAAALWALTRFRAVLC